MNQKEQQIIDLLTIDFLTIAQVASRLKVCERTVYRYIKKLTENGSLGKMMSGGGGWYRGVPLLEGQNIVPTNHTETNPNAHPIRLHGIQIKNKIIRSSQKYQDLLKNTNYLTISGDTYQLSPHCLTVYIKKSFFGKDTNDCSVDSINYVHNLLIRFENKYGMSLLKDRYETLKICKAHYSETNNELAKEHNLNKTKLNIKDVHDGKIWFEIDNSFNLNEAEFKHPTNCKHDCDAITDHFNFVRANPGVLPTVVTSLQSIADTLHVIVPAVFPNAQPATAQPANPEPPADTTIPDYIN